ncbi:MAG: efflux RND transporter periplasmic adaptor subunit [Hyphomicrobiales bacterium]
MAEQDTQHPFPAVRLTLKRRVWIIGMAGVAVALLFLGYWWAFLYNTVSTQDAYAQADSAQISSRVSGTVSRILVDNNDPVRAGQPLVELDPADYTVAVRKAQAVLDKVEADIRADEVQLSQTDAQTTAQVQAAEDSLAAARDTEQQTRSQLDALQSQYDAARAEFIRARKDYNRFEALYRQGSVAAEKRDQARTAYKTTRAGMNAAGDRIAALKASLAGIGQDIDRAKANLASAQSTRYNVDIQRYRLDSLKAQRDQYKADLDAARLNLSYCTIPAPLDGYVDQKWVQVGDSIAPGQALMAVVPLQAVYVEADFKESELAHVRLGQPAKIRADIYPAYTYEGRVAGIGAGTGAAFSLLPPENATGNWIKIVQRVPVKIVLNAPPPPEHPLRVGLSSTVTIDTRDRSGGTLISEEETKKAVSAIAP